MVAALLSIEAFQKIGSEAACAAESAAFSQGLGLSV